MPKIAHLSNSLRQVLSPFLLPFLLAATTFGLHFQGLLESPYANGWDGYFYLIQLKSWVQEGQMHSPDYSPVYWLLRVLFALTKDEMLAFKLLCAGLAALFAFISSLWIQKIGKSTIFTLAIGVWLLFSPSLRFFAAQFPKNLLGIDALLLLLWTLQSHHRGRQILAFALTFLSHRMTAGLSLIFVVLQHFTWRRILVLSFAMAFLVTIAWLGQGILHWNDFARFEGTFQKNPQILAFSFIEILALGKENWLWKAEIWLSLILLFAFALQTIFQPLPNIRSKWQWALLGFCLLLNFPFFVMDERGMGYRFFLAFLLFAPLLLALLLQHRSRLLALLALSTFSILGLGFGRQFPHNQFSADFERYEMLKMPLQQKFKQKPPALLIGHKGLAEYLTYETGFDVLPWQPEYPVDTTGFFRIAFGIFPMEFRYYIPAEDQAFVQELSLNYHLVREDVWQRFVAAVKSAEEDLDLVERIETWENPSTERPSYLRRKNP